MTKARALRNYLNTAFGLQLDGMSQTEVLRQFLHEQFEFESNATSPVGVLQEMAANNLVPSGGGGLEVILNYTVGANDAVGDYMEDGNNYYPIIIIDNAKIKSDPDVGDILYMIIGDRIVNCAIYDPYLGFTGGEFICYADSTHGFLMDFNNDGYAESTSEEAQTLADEISEDLVGTQIIILKAPALPNPNSTPNPEIDDGGK